MSGFLGRYEYQMDGKGRVSLPAAFRRQVDGDRFVLLQWEEPYLTLFPEGEWALYRERLLEFRRSGKAAAHHVREILANAAEVSPDGQGRILVPARLQAAAGLEGTVLLHGNLDRIEIWDPERYAEAAAERDDEAFDRFAHQVFG